MTEKIDNNDLKDMLNNKLLQVCIGEYCIILKFDDDIEINIEGNYKTDLNGKISQSSASSPLKSAMLLNFVGKSITGFKVNKNIVHLFFGDHQSIILLPSESEYESFCITIDDDRIIG